MRGKFITLIFVLLATNGFCDNRGRISFEETVFDFGKVAINQKVTHIFVFSNTGSGTLEITKIEAPCGCTSTLLSKKALNPGEKGKLEVTLHTGSTPMKLVRRVYVHSTDPEVEIVKLIVKADVQAKR
ncbi:MAG: DUF1573 domain-containing protein [Spirochaetes bacterium]|nr:DUF1573 domain-containing protein [Spirochaetota bacterium]